MNTKNINRLDVDERAYIYGCIDRGKSIAQIGRELGRDKSVISRELKRNKEFSQRTELSPSQRAKLAQIATRKRRSEASKRERLKTAAIREYVEDALKKFWSPELISGRIGDELEGASISAEAIYLWVYYERSDLQCYLSRGNRERWKRSGKKKRRQRKIPTPKISIDERPKEANERVEIGHLETDAMVSKQSTDSLMNTVDRKSRKIFLNKTPNLQSEVYSDILIERLKGEVPENFLKTLTLDNGPENSAFVKIQEKLEIPVFFCHPYCASERGTVENRNGFVRRFFPKGTDFRDLPEEYIQYVEDLANNRPMKCLGFRTPNEVWNQALAA